MFYRKKNRIIYKKYTNNTRPVSKVLDKINWKNKNNSTYKVMFYMLYNNKFNVYNCSLFASLCQQKKWGLGQSPNYKK